jgi:hypothetical protein
MLESAVAIRASSPRTEAASRATPPILQFQVMPNPSLKLTRYGRRCKPGPRHMVHHREPGLQRLPPRAA